MEAAVHLAFSHLLFSLFSFPGVLPLIGAFGRCRRVTRPATIRLACGLTHADGSDRHGVCRSMQYFIP
mgnify:CR=1 FL=1|jgi:hypothetical protein